MNEELNIDQRVEQAKKLHRSGFNCSQAVVMAYADLFDIDEQMAARMSASFGGGIGRMRQTCGAACGMFMLCGLKCGQTEPNDLQAKANNYNDVQQLAQEFKSQHGSLICAELIGLKEPEDANVRICKQSCNQTVGNAAQIIGNYLKK